MSNTIEFGDNGTQQATLLAYRDGSLQLDYTRHSVSTVLSNLVTRIWHPYLSSSEMAEIQDLNKTREEIQLQLSGLVKKMFPQQNKITLQGHLGAGKSAVAEILAKELGIKNLSGGHFIREAAKKKSIGAAQQAIIAGNDPTDDINADKIQYTYGLNDDGVVIDGRVGPMTIPHSLKILMTVDPNVAADRIYREYLKGTSKKRNTEAAYTGVGDVLGENNIRDTADLERYLKYYSIDFRRHELYDLVIDTTHKTAEQVAEIILNAVYELDGMFPDDEASDIILPAHFQTIT